MPVRLRDIAEETGISVSAVSHILNERPVSYAPATRKKVRAVARRLGYGPNRIARALRGVRTGALGLITSDLSVPNEAGIVAVVESHLRAQGYRLVIASCWREKDLFKDYLEDLLAQGVDGLILSKPEVYIRAAELEKLLPEGLPVVTIEPLAGLRASCVGVDRRKGTAALIEHALSLGHRSYAYVGAGMNLHEQRQRAQGFQDALNARGLVWDPDRVILGVTCFDAALEVGPRLMSMRPRPTFVFGSNDLVAIGVLRSLRQSGLRVPEDVSVAGFDDLEVARYCEVPLTTVRQPRRLLAQKAVDLILGHIESSGRGAQRRQQIQLMPELVVRQSVGPVPKVMDR